MAQTAFESTVSLVSDVASISIVARDDDPWTPFAPHDEHFEEECLSQASSSVTASTRPSAHDVFDSHEPTIVTQPTSYRATYPGYNYRYKSEADVTYATSLSASHGSVSEDEAEHDTFRHIGGWVSSQPAQGQALRRRENTKVRLSKRLPGRVKKPPVDIHQPVRGFSLAERETELPTEASIVPKESASRCLLHRVPSSHYFVFALICLVALTMSAAVAMFHCTDKADDASRKNIVIVSTVLVSIETILVVLAAGHPLLDASIFGLFPLLTGFMFLLC
ncbi:hypothetical protein E8E13_001841 [Curvularia kusanoi]|uniref:Uncharacterized protein n=1 Tax=Curvularia kusanoi TaxID=90978 RepID=A0A9P4W248_CURKU|nr:hypothetical protein E8E13_001841 [Curvularia kusanoi]